ncbi:helix-turn-helix domain-containing protein [Streptomyces sp. NBC_01013]|uniref:helix-turn-helix domain-containing protein n=1 Tax=Streptomyces sp. NBC_01013 TaxID=2903718 RepID=UPI003864A692|nr:helix-turn-helix domain-containing protein [Streptomyces sp. NBC_01013]
MTQSANGTAAAHPLPTPKERRRLREAKSLSEEQVAAAVGVTRATVRAWETGRTSPRGRKREAYARLIGTGGTRSGSHPVPVKPTTPNGRARAAAARQARSPMVVPPGSETSGAPETVKAAQRSATPTPTNRPPTPVEATGSDVMDPTEPGTTATPEHGTTATPEPGTTAAPETVAGRTAESPALAVAAGSVHAETVATEPVAAGRAGGAEAALADEGADAAAATAGTERADAAEAAAAAEGAGPSPAEAFDALYRHTAPALYRQTYLLTGRRALSREAVGKAFEQAWQRWPEVAVDRDPAGWVRAAAYEHAMSPWHRLRREHRHPDPPPEAPGPRALLDALLALPPSYRRTLLLHDGVGLGLPETAAETEASTAAAAGRLVNARAAVAEQLPELAEPSTPAGQSALLHEHLGALALAQPAPSLPVPDLIRTGCERKAQLWTRAAIAFTVLLIGLTLITLATAPTRYETPQSPPQRVQGVPPLGGPQKLTPQDKELQKKLGSELVRGPGRLVPRAG